MINGAGKRCNHKFGFGRLDVSKMAERRLDVSKMAGRRLDVSKMVDKVLKWKNVDKQRVYHGSVKKKKSVHNEARFVKTQLMGFSGDLIIATDSRLFEPLSMF